MHTIHSDGTLTPRELVERAKSRNLFCIALTDHDTVSGVPDAQAAGREFDLEVIAGVEVSVVFEPGTIHILGYFIDTQNQKLLNGLEKIQGARRERNPKIIELLNKLGIQITSEEVEAESGGDQVGRPHFARVLVKKGYVRDFQEAFDKYLAKGKPAYVDKRNMTSGEALRMIREAGGVASLAHPKHLKLQDPNLFELQIKKLVSEGLGGLEVYSSCQSREESAYYLEVANRFGLTVTGGSDFHGANRPQVDLGWLGGAALFYDTIELLRAKTNAGIN